MNENYYFQFKCSHNILRAYKTYQMYIHFINVRVPKHFGVAALLPQKASRDTEEFIYYNIVIVYCKSARIYFACTFFARYSSFRRKK